MANRHKKQAGGSISKPGVNDYTGSGHPNVVKSAMKTSDGFKKGGKVMGCKSKGRMDKFARGGRAGGSPFSSAHVKTSGDA